LITLADSLRYLGVMLAAFLPDAAAKIRTAIGHTAAPHLADAEIGRLDRLPAVQKLSGLFPRVESKDKAAPADQAAVPAAGRPAQPPAQRSASDEPAAPAGPATINDFRRIDLRVAEVIAAEALPKSKKLLKLTVSLGQEQRTILAGIAQHYAPADLVGKKVVVVANLEPAKLMGLESQGMVLAGSTDDDGALAVLVLDRDLPAGAKVR
jgi:methionyl-tRNA synthetase